jgi:hypothetical protein
MFVVESEFGQGLCNLLIGYLDSILFESLKNLYLGTVANHSSLNINPWVDLSL